jgi:hypothetical protein
MGYAGTTLCSLKQMALIRTTGHPSRAGTTEAVEAFWVLVREEAGAPRALSSDIEDKHTIAT